MLPEAVENTGEASATGEAIKYDAFISYRRTEPDETVAKQLHTLLETYRAPKRILSAGTPSRLRAIFRDVDELSAAPRIDNEVEKALRASRFLIVVCSPRSRASPWVEWEVETFISIGKSQHILLLLIEGEPSDSFPLALVGTDAFHRSLAADVRAPSRRRLLALLRTERLRLLAPMFRCTYGDLKQRELERSMKRLALTVALLSLLLTGAGVAIWQVAASRSQAENRTAQLLVEQARTALASGEYAIARTRLDEANLHGGSKLDAFPFLTAQANQMNSALRFESETSDPIDTVAFTASGRLVVDLPDRIEIRDPGNGVIARSIPQARSTGPIRHLLTSLSSEYIVTGFDGQPMTLWDSATGDKVDVLSENVSFDASGERLLSWSKNGLTITSATQRITRTLSSKEVLSAVFCGPEDSHVLFGTPDGAELIDANSGNHLHHFVTSNPVTVVAADERERQFAFVTRDRDFMSPHILYQANKDAPLDDLGPSIDTMELRFARGESLIANEGSHVAVINPQSHSQTAARGPHEVGSTNVLGGLSPDLSMFTVIAGYGVCVYRATDGALLHEIDADRAGLTLATFAPHGALLLTGGREGAARLWDARSGALLSVFRGFGERVVGAFSSGNALALGGGRRLAVWSWPVGSPQRSIDVPQAIDDNSLDSTTEVVQVTTSGSIYYRDADRRVCRWDPGSAQSKVVAATRDSLTVSADGATIARCSQHERCEITNTVDQDRYPLEGAEAPTDVSFSPDGGRLFGLMQGAPTLWDASNGRLLGALRGFDTRSKPRWSSDGRLVAMLGKSVQLWSAIDSVPFSSLPVSAKEIAFGAENVVLTASTTGAIQSWDTRSRALISTLREASDASRSPGPVALAIDQANRLLAIPDSSDHSVEIYDLATGTLLRRADVRRPGTLQFLRGGHLLLVQEHALGAERVRVIDPSTGATLVTYQGTLAYASETRIVVAYEGAIGEWTIP